MAAQQKFYVDLLMNSINKVLFSSTDQYIVSGVYDGNPATGVLSLVSQAQGGEVHLYAGVAAGGTGNIKFYIDDVTEANFKLDFQAAAVIPITGYDLGAIATPFDDVHILELYLNDGSSNAVIHKAPSTMSSNVTYTWPAAADNGKFLQTDASGILSWVAVGASHDPWDLDSTVTDLFLATGTDSQTMAAATAVTKGDIIYSSDGTNWNRRAIGTEGYILKALTASPNTLPTWGTHTLEDARVHGDYFTLNSTVYWDGVSAHTVYINTSTAGSGLTEVRTLTIANDFLDSNPAPAGVIELDASKEIQLNIATVQELVLDATNLYPFTNVGSSLGKATRFFSSVHARDYYIYEQTSATNYYKITVNETVANNFDLRLPDAAPGADGSTGQILYNLLYDDDTTPYSTQLAWTTFTIGQVGLSYTDSFSTGDWSSLKIRIPASLHLLGISPLYGFNVQVYELVTSDVPDYYQLVNVDVKIITETAGDGTVGDILLETVSTFNGYYIISRSTNTTL